MLTFCYHEVQSVAEGRRATLHLPIVQQPRLTEPLQPSMWLPKSPWALTPSGQMSNESDEDHAGSFYGPGFEVAPITPPFYWLELNSWTHRTARAQVFTLKAAWTHFWLCPF